MKSSRFAQKQPLPYQVSFQLGFTLIEIIIAITILAIMTTIGIASFSSANSGNDVSQQIQEIKTAARRFRTDAMASRKPSSCTTSPFPNVFFGTFVNFQLGANFYFTGSLCYRTDTGAIITAPGTDKLTGNTVFFKTGLTVQALGRGTGASTAVIPLRITIAFANSGQVYFINGTITPSLASFTSAAALSDDRVWADIGNATTKRRITLNKAGLICDELTTVATSCAQ